MDRPPYAATLRLYAIATERWAEIEAHYIAVDLFGLGPRKFLNCIYAWCVERINPDYREQWEADLVAPLPGQEKKAASEAQVEQEGADFMATLAMHQARKG